MSFFFHQLQIISVLRFFIYSLPFLPARITQSNVPPVQEYTTVQAAAFCKFLFNYRHLRNLRSSASSRPTAIAASMNMTAFMSYQNDI
jgi:uncharacterized protein (DUF2062 family)